MPDVAAAPAEGAGTTPHDRILGLLKSLGIPYERLTHPPVAGCDDSVRHRREAGWEGQSSKCILFHARGRFYLVVTTADREIKARLFRRPFGTKDIRFATPEEVRAATGCEVGSVPPFGHSAPDLPVFVDGRILAGGHFLFNPAVPTESLRLGAQDLRRVYAALPNPVTVFDEDAEGRLAFAPL